MSSRAFCTSFDSCKRDESPGVSRQQPWLEAFQLVRPAHGALDLMQTPERPFRAPPTSSRPCAETPAADPGPIQLPSGIRLRIPDPRRGPRPKTTAFLRYVAGSPVLLRAS